MIFRVIDQDSMVLVSSPCRRIVHTRTLHMAGPLVTALLIGLSHKFVASTLLTPISGSSEWKIRQISLARRADLEALQVSTSDANIMITFTTNFC